MPPCDVAGACLAPQRSVYVQLAATRLYSYRLLWIAQRLPGPEAGARPTRTLALLRMLLGMRVHVSVVSLERTPGRHERSARALRHLGVHVLPSPRTVNGRLPSSRGLLQEHAEGTTSWSTPSSPPGCAFEITVSFSISARFTHDGGHFSHRSPPFDCIVVARPETFRAVHGALHREYPSTPLVYDTGGADRPRDPARRVRRRAHAAGADAADAADAAAPAAPAAPAEDEAPALSSAERKRLRGVELDAMEASAVTLVSSEVERRSVLDEAARAKRRVATVVVMGGPARDSALEEARAADAASLAAAGLVRMLARLRDANSLISLKHLSLGSSARPRLYADLRAATQQGGSYFNLTALGPRLDFAVANPNRTRTRCRA